MTEGKERPGVGDEAEPAPPAVAPDLGTLCVGAFAAQAREIVLRECARRVSGRTLEDFELLVSELVTNRIVHGEPGADNTVLLDLRMPIMDGRTFLHAREAAALLSNVPVAVSRSENRCDDMAERYRVNGFLPRPFAPDRLLAAIAACE